MSVSFGPGMIEREVNGKRCRVFLWENLESLKNQKGKKAAVDLPGVLETESRGVDCACKRTEAAYLSSGTM